MTRPKQPIFLGKRIGALLILIFIPCFLINDGHSQDSAIRPADLRRLAQQFRDNNNPFLSYIYNLSFYHLATDSAQKIEAGFDALNASVSTGHIEDGKKIVKLLIKDFPELKNSLIFRYGYLLMRNRQYGEGDNYIRRVPEISSLSARINFLLAYTQITFYNHPPGSLTYLSTIEDSLFPHKEVLSEIKTALSSKPPGSKKYNAIALPLSILIPGSGQMYAGSYFDGFQSLGFNLIVGYATYVSWRHELDKSRGDRNYFLPVTSSVISGLFYLSNILNTVNAVNKANLYRLNKHFSAILENFRIVLQDENYFLNVQLKF